MKIKISKHGLCIPPYLSTSWSAISSIHSVVAPHKNSKDNADKLESNTAKAIAICITLLEGDNIEIPGIPYPIANKIMETFQKHLDTTQQEEKAEEDFDRDSYHEPQNPFAAICNMLINVSQHLIPKKPQTDTISTATLEAITQPFQHNPEQSCAPPLPVELLAKVTDAIKVLYVEGRIPQVDAPVENCNCLHCQVAKHLLSGAEESGHLDVLDDSFDHEHCDISFPEWNVKRERDCLYSVTHSDNDAEKYSVYLGGESIGCTCGEEFCIHIKTVLRSCET